MNCEEQSLSSVLKIRSETNRLFLRRERLNFDYLIFNNPVSWIVQCMLDAEKNTLTISFPLQA